MGNLLDLAGYRAARPLDQVVYDLATYRAELAIMQAELARRDADFKALHNVLIANIREHKDGIATCESVIRGATYSADDRHPAPGLSVKEVTQLTYDEAQALEWAIVHKHDTLLSLKRASFERVAEGLRLAFVTITKVPTVTIARNLAPAAAEIAARWEAERFMEQLASKPGGVAGLELDSVRDVPAERIITGYEAEPTIIQTRCGWCYADLGQKDGQGVSGESHGMCRACRVRYFPETLEGDDAAATMRAGADRVSPVGARGGSTDAERTAGGAERERACAGQPAADVSANLAAVGSRGNEPS